MGKTIPIRLLLSPDEKIDQIRIAFETYALGDIEVNIKERPIAAFILCSCLIDQLSAFRYNVGELDDHRHYYQLFIKQYLNKYDDLQLYKSLRCKLVHNYSVDEHISLMSESETIDNNANIHANAITAKTLHKDLYNAWQKLKKEFLTEGSDARKNALLKFDAAPPLIEDKYKILRYSKEEAEFLCLYYKDELKGKCISNNPKLIITALIIEDFKEEIKEFPEDKYVVLAVAKKSKTKRIYEHLDVITEQLEIEHPLDILKLKHLY